MFSIYYGQTLKDSPEVSVVLFETDDLIRASDQMYGNYHTQVGGYASFLLGDYSFFGDFDQTVASSFDYYRYFCTTMN